MAPGSLTCNPGRHQELVAGWFQELHPGIFRYLVRLLDDQESAADLTQETFIRALTALANQPVPDNPSAWLYRIATNLAYDAMRRRNRLRWLPLTGQERAPAFESQVTTAQSVRQALARLKSRDAEALLLYEYAGLSCVEIAALNGDEPATVRVRLHRARQQFRKWYEPENDER